MKSEIGYLPQYPNFSLDDSERNAYVYGPTFGIEKEELLKSIPKMLEKVGLKEEEIQRLVHFLVE